MKSIKHCWLTLVFVGLLPLLAWAETAGDSAGDFPKVSVRAPHITASLASEAEAVYPGQVLALALRLQTDEGWHSYWRNPGDTGLPTRIDWQLPEGFAAGSIQWPVPERIPFQELVNFGYHGDTWLLTSIRVPTELPAPIAEAGEVQLAATAKWLVCKDVCIPGQADLQLVLPVAQVAPALPGKPWFDNAREKIPQLGAGVKAVYSVGNSLGVKIDLDTLPVIQSKPQLFVAKKGLVQNGALPQLEILANQLLFTFAKDKYLEDLPAELPLVLVSRNSSGDAVIAIEFIARLDSTQDGTFGGNVIAAAAGITNPTSSSLPYILLLALLGGLILNAMPCVFPVLSLKVISLVESGNHSGAERRQHGLAYTAGVVLSFLLIAAVLVTLRALGQQVGWGFQLQSPVFIALLVYILFALGLSLSGFFEFGSSLQNIGSGFPTNTSGLQRRSWTGSFYTGVLAAVVATPCTAPFMGTAMAFALAQSTIVAALVFAVMGLGLAMPFLLVAFVPVLVNLLPKPGNWMLRLKEFLAFPMYFTVAWLLWVFGRQTGTDALVILLVGLVAMVLAIWLWRTVQFKDGAGLLRLLALVILAVAFSLVFVATRAAQTDAQASTTMSDSGGESSVMAYSEAGLEKALDSGRPVFVNMTADWCITCKVNERVALGSNAVLRAFDEQSMVYIKGDWTNSDPTITRYLESFNRNGVPLYVYYPVNGEPRVLPQILTPDIVVDAIQ